MLILIDNYDSFTYNLVHYLGELGADSVVIRNDKISAEEVIAKKPRAIVLSPGPCTPNEAGVCLDLIKKAGPNIPLLGVCLGHHFVSRNLVIANDKAFRAELAEIVDEIVGKAVVVIDQDQHRPALQ